MRIRGWHIDGFGIHRDWRVDDLSPGLTVFHGPNEAGKTTLLAFLRGVLFGYPDGRSHEPKYPPTGGGPHGGRVFLEGTVLEGSGAEGAPLQRGRVVVERFVGRGQTPSVTLEDGTAGDADDLAERLGHADARLFRNVYAFGLAELQELGTLGDAGIQDHLFSAGITGAGRSARQAGRELQEASRGLFAGVRARKSDRARVLAVAIAERRSELSLRQQAAERYSDLRDSEQALAAQLEGLKSEAERHQAAEQRARKLVELWNEVWNPLAELREQSAKLAPHDQDELPLDARSQLEMSLGQIQVDQERLAAIRAEREALGSQLAELCLDETARAVAPRVDALHHQLPLHRSRCDRLTEIDAQIAECDRRRRSIGAHLGVSELRAFRLTATCRDELREWKRRLDAGRLVQADWVVDGAHASQNRNAALTGGKSGVVWVGLAALVFAFVAAAFWTGRFELLPFALVPAGGAIVVRRKAAREAAERHAERARELARIAEERRARERAAAELEQEFSDWKRKSGIPAALAPDTAGEFLEDVRRARDLLEERDRLGADRQRIQSEVAAWEAGVDDVVADCDFPAPDERDRCALLLSLRESCEADRIVREHRKPLERRGGELRERFVACEAILAESRATLADLLEEADASSIEDLQRRLAARDAARELAERIATAESDLSRRIEAGDLEEAEALREELPLGRVGDWQELASEARILATRAREERDEVLRQHQNAALALERLERSTEVVDLEQEKAALEQELHEVVDDWRKLRLASRLVETALERFEGQHQPGVLREAGRLFSQVTAGRYPRIVQSEEPAGFSVLTSEGMHRSPRELSRGTAEQLYLCVRLGLVAELTRTRVQLPVVMDDVLVNFDDERGAAMAAVLADFAADHQLFFFTCNARTRDLLASARADVDERSLAAPLR